MTDESFGAVVKRCSAATPDMVAVAYGEDRLSWCKLDARSDARAAQLLAAGVVRDVPTKQAGSREHPLVAIADAGLRPRAEVL